MNVASLQHYPSIKWYFVTAAPLVSVRYFLLSITDKTVDAACVRFLVWSEAASALRSYVKIYRRLGHSITTLAKSRREFLDKRRKKRNEN